MIIGTLLENLKIALAEDGTLDTWCKAVYGSGLTVFHPDDRDPPGENDCPYVSLRREYRRVTRTHKECAIALLMVVNEEGAPTRADANIEDFQGTGHLDTFSDYVADVVLGISLGNAETVELSTEYDEEINLYPNFQATTTWVVGEQRTIGDDPME